MDLIDSDISSAQLQCMNESKLCRRFNLNQSGYSLQQSLHYKHYLERDKIAYFICGCAMELPTRNFKLYQHIVYRDKSCHDNRNMIYFKLSISVGRQNHSIIKKKR